MAKDRAIRLQFPLAGLDRRYSYRQQPPFTTPDCRNVRPSATLEGRARGGQRPGLVKAYPEQVSGASNPIRMASSVTVVQPTGTTHWVENFIGEEWEDDGLGGVWSTASWAVDSPHVVGTLAGPFDNVPEAAAVRDLIDIDTAQSYTVAMHVVPYEGQFHGSYRLYARLNDTTPDITQDGLIVELVSTGSSGDYTGSLTVIIAGVSATIPFTAGTGDITSGWLEVLINGDDITCYWQDTVVLTNTIGAQTGKRVGFGFECTVDGGVTTCDQYRVIYYSLDYDYGARSEFVTSADGELWHSNGLGHLVQLTTDLTLNDDRLILATEREQKLYIADHGDPVAVGGDGVMGGAGNNVLTAASITDWTALSFNTLDYVCVITNGLGGTTDGVYEITSIAAGSIELTLAPGDGTCSYSVERGPKIYDPVAGTLELWMATAGKGFIPVGCPNIDLYRDRLTLSGKPAHLWYMSRQQDPLDFDYSQTDAQRAAAGDQERAGRVGQPIRAMRSHTDDYLVFGGKSQTWVMKGDPAFSGDLMALSRRVGCVDRGAMCYGPEGQLLYLTMDGLYEIAPGAQAYPQSRSREKLPRELRDIDYLTHTTLMAYDTQDRGLHIFITREDEAQMTHWWYDWEGRSFWPMGYASAHEPTAIHAFTSHFTDMSAVLLGCRDGYIRKFSPDAGKDDDEGIDSYVLYGPIDLGGDDYNDGMVTELRAVVAKGSGDVDWSTLVADDFEQATDEDADASGTWEAGSNVPDFPRSRGPAFILKLENGDPAQAWAMERVTARIRRLGRHRM